MLIAMLGVSTLLWAGNDPAVSTENQAAYQAMRDKAGRDAEAHVKLALWCESHGLSTERLEQLTLAVANDPSHAMARGLLGFVLDGEKWRKPDAVAANIKNQAQLAEALAEYNAKRATMGKTADAHWNMALWCEQHGLKAEADAHMTAVTRLEPSRASAWKHLGFKKVNGRWMTDAMVADQKADAEAQKKADKTWRPQLQTWREMIHGKDAARRDEAQAKLSGVNDPRSLPSIRAVFLNDDAQDQKVAVQLLGQIDSSGGSRTLALIALKGATADVRRSAVETLVNRDPRDYLAPLIALLREPLKYEVRPVNGPGQPGALFVEGKQFNRMLVYAPPALPAIAQVDSQGWATDGFGNDVLRIGGTQTDPATTQVVARITGTDFRNGLPANDPRSKLEHAALGNLSAQGKENEIRHLFKHDFGNTRILNGNDFDEVITKRTTNTRETETSIPVGQIRQEYAKAALSAEAQLERDVAAVEAENADINRTNDLVNGVLVGATGVPLPPRKPTWEAWWADKQGYPYVDEPPAFKPTLFENVPPAYLPQPIASRTSVGKIIKTEDSYSAAPEITSGGMARMHNVYHFPYGDCFAAGTPVNTRSGRRPIESLEVGDNVLCQDMASGKLGYRPVLATFKFRPAETIRVQFNDETITTTPVHRFWKVGGGWVMAKELKPGQVVRTLGGTATVRSIENDEVRQVFNLEVAEDADYFVGKTDILAHDNTEKKLRTARFDAGAAR